jgi:MoaA/NifB/PqqE/SkfB family radical SAM enzyme
MPEDVVDAALAGLKVLRVNDVALNGHGETTVLRNWHAVSAAVRRTGARVHLTSNFARPFTAEELDELVRLKSVVVSLDTDDADLLRAVRRHVDLATIVANLRNLRNRSSRLGLPGPKVVASCVVHTRNVMHLDRFVRFALRHGIGGFVFCNLIKSRDLTDGLNVDHVATLPADELLLARAKILQAKGIAMSKGATCEVVSGLVDSIDGALSGKETGSRASLGNRVRHFTPPGEGQTRRCLDPWFYVQIRATGAVLPCCWHPPVGSMSEGPLEAVLNGAEVVDLRRRLLTGDLDDHCRTCPARPVSDLQSFAMDVGHEVPRSAVSAGARMAAISLKHALRRAEGAFRSLPRVAG